MPDPFADLIPEARAFLSELARNNSRDWFNGNKSRFETSLKTPATLLLEQVAAVIGPGTGTKLFRQQRDIRFSKDKTPYHIHLHMMWTLPESPPAPGLFFGISPDYVSIGGGVMGFDKTALTSWRQEVDGPRGDALSRLLDSYRAKGFRIGEPELRRVPAPFDRDHPNKELLLRKSLTIWNDLAPKAFNRPLGALQDTFTQLSPLFTALRDALG